MEGYQLFDFVLREKALDFSLRRLWTACSDAQIGFLQLVVPDLFVDDTQRLRILGRDDNAARVPVNAVAQRRGEGVLLPGTPFTLLVEVRLDVVDQRVDLLCLVGVDYQTGRLSTRSRFSSS